VQVSLRTVDLIEQRLTEVTPIHPLSVTVRRRFGK
jgi:hypothetical protein